MSERWGEIMRMWIEQAQLTLGDIRNEGVKGENSDSFLGIMEQGCEFTLDFLDDLKSGGSWDEDEAEWEKVKALNLFLAGAAWGEVRRREDSNKQLAMFAEQAEQAKQIHNLMRDNRRRLGG